MRSRVCLFPLRFHFASALCLIGFERVAKEASWPRSMTFLLEQKISMGAHRKGDGQSCRPN
ncbi:hypothetical protein M5K25_019919 [Dendrobium thyrsiflorum]|uniref:Secreted protein n=1 Tax=Dendrobium thyrsiflorum TaxID=117978 RepID=A0ABD0UNG3_DENTH